MLLPMQYQGRERSYIAAASIEQQYLIANEDLVPEFTRITANLSLRVVCMSQFA